MRSAALRKIKLDRPYLTADSLLYKFLKHLSCARERNVAECIDFSASKPLANVSAICELNSLRNGNEHRGMILLYFRNRSEELFGIKAYFRKINKVGRDTAREPGKSACGSEPARITSHYLYNSDRLCSINRHISKYFFHRNSNIFCGRTKSRSMICHHKIVINRLWYTNHTHFIIVI